MLALTTQHKQTKMSWRHSSNGNSSSSSSSSSFSSSSNALVPVTSSSKLIIEGKRNVSILYDVIIEVAKHCEDKMMAIAFNDFQYCKEHQRLNNRHFYQHMPAGEYNENKPSMNPVPKQTEPCGCPATTFSDYDVVAALINAVKLSGGNVKSSRDKWEENFMTSRKSAQDNAYVQSDLSIKEVGSFITYMSDLFMLAQLRRSEIQVAIELCNDNNNPGMIDKSKLPNDLSHLMNFDQTITRYTHDIRKRLSSIGVSTEILDRHVNTRYCEQHNRCDGDAAPYRPFYLYDGCGICIRKKKPPRAPSQKYKESNPLFGAAANGMDRS